MTSHHWVCVCLVRKEALSLPWAINHLIKQWSVIKGFKSFTSQAIQRDSNNHNYYEKRGNAYLVEKKWQKAIEDYTQAIRINPNNVIAYRNRGEARFNLGDIQGAIQDLRKAASLYQAQGKTYDYKVVQRRIIQLIIQLERQK